MSAAQENTVTDAQAQFEDWYVQNAFDYAANPIGSRDCGLMRRAWHAALAATGKQQDGCTESNCRRCLTHPDHRGDIPHAGICSTGKQQVGDVQGDALSLADHITNHLCHHEYDIGGRSELLACVTEALAARQPGAQERVAWASTGATGHKVVAMPGLHKLPYGDYDLYAAPPAQGRDTGNDQAATHEPNTSNNRLTQGIDMGPRPMDTAPLDGTLVRLLVDFDENTVDDSIGATWTIGACNDDNVSEGARIGWQFAGWCWTHDHFTEGTGTPVGWLPLIDGQRDAAQGVSP